MCGVTGLWDQGAATGAQALAEAIGAMTATLHHRGPDDRGAWVDAPAGIALGHTQLAVVDLSPAGAQPMVSGDGRVVLVFNGEIYNAQELQGELIRAGREFRGHSDTEVLVEALAAWGVEETLKQILGMFAFAAWDRSDRKLVLARDRLGKKPLYWSSRNGQVAFGSELKALRAGPWAPHEIDRDALAAYLRWRFVPAPQCIYRGVRKLPAGHWVELRASGEMRLERYLGRALGGDRRRELRRQWRRLEAQGQVECRWLAAGNSPTHWIDGFLALEAKGWKGANDSAMASKANQIPFFRSVVAEMHARGRALLGGLALDGRWIAMNCSLRAAAPDGGAFAFKTTYDESLGRFAPGLLLEVEFVRRLFERSDGIPWLDSCCGPENMVIARLWADRRPIGDLTLAAPSLKGTAGLWALQLMAEQARRPSSHPHDGKLVY